MHGNIRCSTILRVDITLGFFLSIFFTMGSMFMVGAALESVTHANDTQQFYSSFHPLNSRVRGIRLNLLHAFIKRMEA